MSSMLSSGGVKLAAAPFEHLFVFPPVRRSLIGSYEQMV